ncbi:MAG TPA: AMP-binding protein [Candidatus Acidoferrales bacterium]|jgi:long-chain acyl-CoA synthetase|nr:AMP-binding protein [Candidatus Acidoferrales bacterium]
MNFLENIFSRLQEASGRVVLAEAYTGGGRTATGSDLLAHIATARGFLRASGLAKGDRCALVAPNSIRWAALDFAIIAEGLIAVPMYARQAAGELAAMLRDAGPRLTCCGDAAMRDAISAASPDAPRFVLFDEIFGANPTSATTPATTSAVGAAPSPISLALEDTVAILYTSGTSGEAKGVMLTVGNLDHMLSCTKARLDELMGPRDTPDRVFHYLPFCFAGSWILLLSCLSRTSVLTISMDLTKLAEEIGVAEPHYFLNVPTLLERIRSGVGENIRKRGGAIARIFERASAAWLRLDAKAPHAWDFFWLGLAGLVIFPSIRKRLGQNLRALICGSAPLACETQLFFMMLGIRVLQVYGLTETTAICTMDDPRHVEPGRVGPAIPGIEMKIGENSEIVVRGPNISPGYWRRPEQTAAVLRDGWFHTGDQGDVNANGNWRITGRLKNLIILNSGHNIAPEPIEEELFRAVPGAQHVMLVGNGRGFLAAIITGAPVGAEINSQLERVNGLLPHYRKIRKYHVAQELFTIENGLLTANGKLRRDMITARFAAEIERMYAKE